MKSLAHASADSKGEAPHYVKDIETTLEAAGNALS